MARRNEPAIVLIQHGHFLAARTLLLEQVEGEIGWLRNYEPIILDAMIEECKKFC